MIPIIVEKPYKFVPPYRSTFWSVIAQRFKLIDYWLKRKHGVVSWECRHVDRLQASLQSGAGVMLTPNHCRPCDPIAIGWLAREAGTHLHAMASWHLFNQDSFSAFAIRRLGGFSVYREGIDRQAISTAVEIVTSAERPLILFPEGAVTRTNDKLQALLDGVAFIARSAAKKRAKLVPGSKVVVHPIAMKYLLQSDIVEAVSPVLAEIEHRLTWRCQDDHPVLERITRIGMALLALQELGCFGEVRDGRLANRLKALINHLLSPLEREWLGGVGDGPAIPRIKALRMKIMPDMIRGDLSPEERSRRWKQLERIYVAQQVASYPPDYIKSLASVDRLLETVERFEEDLTDQVRVMGPLKCVIEVGHPIEVATKRTRTPEGDPLMIRLAQEMQEMLDGLARESPMLPLDAVPARRTSRKTPDIEEAVT